MESLAPKSGPVPGVPAGKRSLTTSTTITMTVKTVVEAEIIGPKTTSIAHLLGALASAIAKMLKAFAPKGE